MADCAIASFASLVSTYNLSVVSGDLLYLNNHWYVTHTGLLRLAYRRRCAGIRVLPVRAFCNPAVGRWAFKATVLRSKTCKGFVGFGDADPSNVSSWCTAQKCAWPRRGRSTAHCARPTASASARSRRSDRCPSRGRSPRETEETASPACKREHGGPKVRDRLCQLIRQHQLDANLVKSYAVDFCGTKTLREATREQVENFVAHLADWAEKDRNALLCQLNSYLPAEGSAA